MNEALFILAYLSTCLAMGLFAYLNLHIFRLSSTARMLLGISATPFYLAIFPLLLAVLYPSAPRIVILLSPSLIPTIYLAVNWKYLIKMAKRIVFTLKNFWRQFSPLTEVKVFHLFLILSSIIIFSALLMTVYQNANSPMNDHDGTVYFNESLPFAEGKSINSIPEFDAPANTVVRNNPHTFYFQSLISLGLMATNGKTLGFPHDEMARYLVQSVVISFLLAFIALGLSYRKAGLTAISFIFLLSLPLVGSISANANRDAFRLLPITILLVLLLALLKNKIKINWKHALTIGLVSSICILSHTLDIVFLSLLMLIFLPFFLFKYSVRPLLLWTPLLILFCLLAFIPYIQNYLHYHNFFGHGMTFLSTKGTALEYFNNQILSKFKQMNLFNSIEFIFSEYGYFIPILSLIFSFIILLLIWKGKLPKYLAFLPVIFLAFLLLPLVISNQLTGISLKTGMLMNYRYPLYFIVLCGFIIAPIICLILDKLKLAPVTATVGLIIISPFVIQNISTSWKPSYDVNSFMQETVFSLAPYINSLSKNENWYTDNLRASYYYQHHPVFAYSHHWDQLLKATSEAEVKHLIKKWNLKLFIIYKYDSLYAIKNGLALNQVLNGDSYSRSENRWWVLYRRKKDVS